MSLDGHFLVASRELLDPNFARSVVLIVRHSEEGAMGLVLNRPTKTSVAEAWKQVSEAPCPASGLIHLGGPCRGPLMAIHRDPALGELEIVPTVYLSQDSDNVEQLISKGEDSARFFIGFAGWGPGQLESEMREDSWLTAPASDEQIFDSPYDIWSQLTRQIYGLKMLSALHIKNAPADPSLN
jgi:putative transcriptional regulator